MTLDMKRRQGFVKAALEHRGDVVCWGGLDCSELVAISGESVGLPNRSASYRAQTYFDTTEPISKEQAVIGDLVFWGEDDLHVIHVGIVLEGGFVLSADGATHRVTDLREALKNPHARVRVHQGTDWYRSAPFRGYRRQSELDEEVTKP